MDLGHINSLDQIIYGNIDGIGSSQTYPPHHPALHIGNKELDGTGRIDSGYMQYTGYRVGINAQDSRLSSTEVDRFETVAIVVKREPSVLRCISK